MKKDALLSVIIPVYNEEEVLPLSYKRFTEALLALAIPYELIYVNDGSTDRTMQALRELSKTDEHVRVLSFSRNFGHQLAVTCGMDHAKGDALIIIDADLQDPPELIGPLMERFYAGAHIVYGKRTKRKGETIFKRFTAYLYYRLLSSMSAYPIPLDSGDFRLISREVADLFLNMREHNRFLRGMSAWMGYDAEPLEYVRAEREAGKTKYTLKKMLKLAFVGIAGFSIRPLTMPGYLGMLLLGMSGLSLIALIVLALTIGVAPWLFALCGLVFLQALTLITLGIQGAYLGRIYDEAKKRPLYIVRERLGFHSTNEDTATT